MPARATAFRPKLHLFVCANRRDASSPLGQGCGPRGDAVYAALKSAVAARGEHASTWVTRTYCLGVCPREGATVVRYPSGEVLTEVEPEDAGLLLDS